MIELVGISKVFSMADGDIRALADINLKFNDNEFAVLAGASGCGKTTLLNIIGCLDAPSSGRLMVDDIDVSTLSRKQLAWLRYEKIGFIFQSFNLIPTLNIKDNILLGLAVGRRKLRRPLSSYQEEFEEIIELVGLQRWLKHRPFELSGGQQQRVAIARALIKKPRLLLADEPTANLDSENSAAIIDLMQNLNAKLKNSCIISTHDLKVQEKASRLISLSDGRVAGDSQRQ